MEEEQNKRSAAPIFIAVAITLLVVGGIAFEAYQQKKTDFDEQADRLRLKVDELQAKAAKLEEEKLGVVDQLDSIKKQFDDLAAKLTATGTASSTIDFCSTSPVPSAVGRDDYPIDRAKYTDFGYLGQLFTASDCSATRTALIYGVSGSNFTLKPELTIKEAPTSNLVKTLKAIGFTADLSCKGKPDTECLKWKLNKIVPLDQILNLKPYGNIIYLSN